MKTLLLLSLFVAAQCDLCWYYDDFLDKDKYFYCDNGCCDDVCCDDYYYWDGGSIAGATVGSIVGFIIFLAILITVIRICCGYGRYARPAYVRHTTTAQPAVTVVSSTTTANPVATPYMHYPKPEAPPPYVPQAQGAMRIDNPNFQYAPPQKY